MTPEQFTYWLQGYVEINGDLPSVEEWNTIKDHLQLVFTKITPEYAPYKTYEAPAELSGKPYFPFPEIYC